MPKIQRQWFPRIAVAAVAGALLAAPATAQTDQQELEKLKQEIQDVMATVGDFKVIGFPRPSLDVPVVITTWERMLRMPEFDPAQAELFARTYRNQAPEPNAP